MLYIQDQSGTYRPAPKDTVLIEARRLSSYQLRRGVSITSPAAAKDAIATKLIGLECEMFAWKKWLPNNGTYIHENGPELEVYFEENKIEYWIPIREK